MLQTDRQTNSVLCLPATRSELQPQQECPKASPKVQLPVMTFPTSHQSRSAGSHGTHWETSESRFLESLRQRTRGTEKLQRHKNSDKPCCTTINLEIKYDHTELSLRGKKQEHHHRAALPCICTSGEGPRVT